MCQCNNVFLYKDYKEKKEKDGFLVSLDLKDDDCVNCHFEMIYGTIKEDDLKSLMSERIKKRFNVECNCGCYYPYKKHVQSQTAKGKLIAPMMPLDKCYNCYFISKYGTLDSDIIKKKRVEDSLKRINNLKKLKLI